MADSIRRLTVEPGSVWAVLLGDAWHKVAPMEGQADESSFELGSFDFVEYPPHPTGGGVHGDRDTLHPESLTEGPRPGFVFIESGTGRRIYGPLSSVLAVDTRQPPKPKPPRLPNVHV